jgi:hypothetical protein
MHERFSYIAGLSDNAFKLSLSSLLIGAFKLTFFGGIFV